MAPKFFTDKQARAVLEKSYQQLFQRLESAMGQFSGADTIIQPVRTCLNIPVQHSASTAPGSMFLTMPAYSSMDKAISTKLLSSFPGNKDCPVTNAIIALFDADNGMPQAILEGNAITEIRTAMTSAVAVHHLRDHDRMHRLAVLGSGVQGRAHINVFKSMYNFETVSIWSRTFQNAQKLAKEEQAVAYRTVAEAVKDADVVVTATNSMLPILEADWLKANVLVCGVGACRHDWRELSDDVMRKSLVVTDSRDAALQEAGDVIHTGVEIHAEIGEIINGTKTIDKNATLIVFKSLGMAVQDTVAAKLVYECIGEN